MHMSVYTCTELCAKIFQKQEALGPGMKSEGTNGQIGRTFS